jgi:hypothetical protein
VKNRMHALRMSGPDFRECYAIAERRLPGQSKEVLMRETAILLVQRSARARGHIPLTCGMSVECGRCDASCSVDPKTWELTGKLSDDDCPAAPRARVVTKAFPIGARVRIDGRNEAIVREVFPEGSTSFLFPHYKVDMVHGDKNVAVAMTRVSS